MENKLRKILRITGMLSLSLVVFTGCTNLENTHKNTEKTQEIKELKLTVGQVKRIGIMRPRGISTWMYGTNVLVDQDGNIISALIGKKSIRLVDYEGHEVEVIGKLKDGYPVDNGPEYVEVERIKVLHR